MNTAGGPDARRTRPRVGLLGAAGALIAASVVALAIGLILDHVGWLIATTALALAVLVPVAAGIARDRAGRWSRPGRDTGPDDDG